jgi:glycosyltransferase involved in cell wall biosynthesis
MGKIRIIWLFNVINYGNGPLQRALRLDKEKYEIYFIVLKGGGDSVCNIINNLGFNSRDYNVIASINCRKINLRNLLSIKDTVLNIDPHIIQSTSIWNAVIATFIKLFSLNVPHVMFDGGMLGRYSNKVRISRAIASFVAEKDIFISQGVASSRSFIEKLIQRKSKVEVVYNGVDFEEINAACKSSSEIRKNYRDNILFGHVGDYKKEKNHTLLLKTFQSILKSYPSAKLIVAGKDLDQVKNLAVKYNLYDSIVFLGFVPRSDLYEYLSIFDIFLFPSTSEGMPEAVVQAIAAKVPVIASDIPAHNELYNIVKFGSIVDFCDINAVMTAIDKELSEKLITCQERSLFTDVFNINNVVKKYENIYSALLR